MFRADDPDADPNANGTGKAGYTEGEPGVTAPTPTRADALNNIQEELCYPVTEAGLTLDKTKKHQVQSALNVRAANMVLNSTMTAVTYGSAPASDIKGALWWDATTSTDSKWIAYGSAGEIQTASSQIGGWTQRTAGGSYTDILNDGAAIGGRVVLCGDYDGTYTVQTSTNGTSWTAAACGTADMNGVATDGTTFVVVGDSGSIFTSTNGTTWSSRTPAAAFSGTFEAVCWSATNSLFVAVGGSGGTREIQTSPDGITWTQRTPAAAGSGSNKFKSVVEVPLSGVIVTTDDTTNYVEYSLDGVTWAAATLNAAATNSYHQVAIVAGAPVLVSQAAGASQIQYNMVIGDGVTFETPAYAREFQAGGTLKIAECNGAPQYMLVGDDGIGVGIGYYSGIGGI